MLVRHGVAHAKKEATQPRAASRGAAPADDAATGAGASGGVASAVSWLSQLGRLIALCWMELDDDLIKSLVSEMEEDFREAACGPMVGALPDRARHLLVGRAGVAELAAAAAAAAADGVERHAPAMLPLASTTAPGRRRRPRCSGANERVRTGH